MYQLLLVSPASEKIKDQETSRGLKVSAEKVS